MLSSFRVFVDSRPHRFTGHIFADLIMCVVVDPIMGTSYGSSIPSGGWIPMWACDYTIMMMMMMMGEDCSIFTVVVNDIVGTVVDLRHLRGH